MKRKGLGEPNSFEGHRIGKMAELAFKLKHVPF